MNRDLLVARLVAMRAMIDAWIIEATETEAQEREVETYGSKAGSDKVSGVVNGGSDKTRGD